MIVHEFDYKGENEVVYEENGVTIRSWPANHVIDGSVSYGLEWNGLKFVFGGDTYPNNWFVKYATDACVHGRSRPSQCRSLTAICKCVSRDGDSLL